ncbi:MAG: hypothetical protein LBR51_03065 [Bacteroidales bacterium]|jgi:hypothetical protein|nr:hypothetical protein [Bacteroidales bacterium]
MKLQIRKEVVVVFCAFFLASHLIFAQHFSADLSSFSRMEDGFKSPPDSLKPGVYWYWLNEHVSREGITADLEALHAIGIGEAFIGNIYEERLPRGAVRTLSPEWEDCMRFALTEGNRIGIKVSAFNCPGWSQAGGPWVKPEQAMRYLTYSKTYCSHNSTSKIVLPAPTPFFQDVATLAFPITTPEDNAVPKITSSCNIEDLPHLTDRDTRTDAIFHNADNEPVTLCFSYPQKIKKRSVLIVPSRQFFKMTCEVYADHILLKTISFDRQTDNLSYGPEPRAPLSISLGEAFAKEFKIVMKGIPARLQLSEVRLESAPKIEQYSEKLNNKMPLVATPDWHCYQWATPHGAANLSGVPVEAVLDISSYRHGDTLSWQPPAGHANWQILRLGMSPTGKTNKPAAPDGTGLEIDKMSRVHLPYHYDSYIGKIIKGIPDSLRVPFYRVIADSYETGPGNWTDGFRETFQSTYGYDPTPWLAVFSGVVVKDMACSDRFAWDLRRLVADRIASEFVGGMAEVCARHGSELWLENYGWDGFPSEFLKYAKAAPSIGGEFWTTSPNVESRLAASACHIYNKNIVYAESYTTGGGEHLFKFHPGNLKPIGDQAYTEGINQHIFHLTIHQPYTDKYPGINSWFGMELNRQNTWFARAKDWIDYQRRCCFMLQQGQPAADVCFFIGEDCPKMAGWKDSTLAKGYDYDFVNADVIMHDMTVKDGRLYLPSGVNYALLALPPLDAARPELLAKIEELVKAGATISGVPVKRAPGLQNYPYCDRQVQDIALRLWGTLRDKPVPTCHKTGKGQVFSHTPINQILENLGIPEAVHIPDHAPVLWKQRVLPDHACIYFLTNQSDSSVDFEATFRVHGLTPEWWNAIDGTTRVLPQYRENNNQTLLPLHLEAYESCFIVFRTKQTEPPASAKNYITEKEIVSIENSWNILFKNHFSGEQHVLTGTALFDWRVHAADSIRYFSGTATYSTSFDMPPYAPEQSLYLSLEHVGVIAEVRVNGQPAPTRVWTPPYRTCITPLLKTGNNVLEIEVTNLWRNKLIDKLQGIDPRNPIWMLEYPTPAAYGNTLSPSGLWGKVRIVAVE